MSLFISALLRRGAQAALVVAFLLPAQYAAAGLVSNLGEAERTGSISVGVVSVNDFSRYQTFTTDSNPSGYTFNSATLSFNDGGLGSFQVAILNDSTGSPGSQLVALSGNSTPTTGTETYTGTATLTASTTYWLALSQTGAALSTFDPYSLNDTESAAEDNSTLPGWLIADSHFSSTNGGSTVVPQSPVIKVALDATILGGGGAVPLPGTLALLGLGLAAAGVSGRRGVRA